MNFLTETQPVLTHSVTYFSSLPINVGSQTGIFILEIFLLLFSPVKILLYFYHLGFQRTLNHAQLSIISPPDNETFFIFVSFKYVYLHPAGFHIYKFLHRNIQQLIKRHVLVRLDEIAFLDACQAAAENCQEKQLTPSGHTLFLLL